MFRDKKDNFSVLLPETYRISETYSKYEESVMNVVCESVQKESSVIWKVFASHRN